MTNTLTEHERLLGPAAIERDELYRNFRGRPAGMNHVAR